MVDRVCKRPGSAVRRRILVAVASALVLAGGAARADWLVTRDGAQLEIRGPWEVEGQMVIFTLADGTFSSLRLSAVDLEASQRLTEHEARAATEPEPASKAGPRQATFVLTDADVGHIGGTSPASPDAPTGPEGEAGGEETEPAAAKLSVTGWRELLDEESNAVQIVGTLHNPGANPATSISLEVVLYDDAGTLLERSTARLAQSFLPGGSSTQFVAPFADTLSFSAVKFDLRSRGFVARPPTPVGDEETEPGDEG